MPVSRMLAVGILLGVLWLPAGVRSAAVEVLRPLSALPAHIANQFSDRSVFAIARTGQYIVLDKREHRLYAVDAAGTLRRIVDAGVEWGQLSEPEAMAVGGDDIVGVIDTPNGFDRVQYFSLTGMRIGGFYLPLRTTRRFSVEGLMLDGASSLGFTGRTFLINQPEWGALFAEFDVDGQSLRQIGVPRVTGPPVDRDVDRAMNIGIPIVDPTGGYFFVFQTGVPLFRKYAEDGSLVLERHIEGPELDARIRSLPTTWGPRAPGTMPVVSPLVRAAAADRRGQLWISLAVPYSYVYDGRGEKIRTVQFQAAGMLSASSLFFTATDKLVVSPGGYVF